MLHSPTVRLFPILIYRQCIVANVDADAEVNRPLALKYGIQSYPTIKFFPKGGEPIDYEGGRQEADFVQFLNEKCGTYRAVGGSLNEEVGFDDSLFKPGVTRSLRLAVILNLMPWLVNSSLPPVLLAMPFTRKHPHLLRKSALLPLTTSV